MTHKCTKRRSITSEWIYANVSLWERLKMRLLNLILVSPRNPLAILYFRSETAMREERTKQLKSKHRCIIHPLSMFRLVYEAWVTILYSILLVTKPIDGALTKYESMGVHGYVILSLTLDVFSWIDIWMSFRTGYLSQQNKIILNPKKIAKHYIRSIFFFADVLSSIPRFLFQYIIADIHKYNSLNHILGLIVILCQLKILRLITVIGNIYKFSRCFNIRSKGVVFWLSGFVITTVIIHWTACLQLTIPRIGRRHFADNKRHYIRWLKMFNLYRRNFFYKYIQAFFKSSACFLGIRVSLKQMFSDEDYWLAILTYVFGKIVMCCVMVVITVSILSNRSMEIKFYVVKNELDEYMRQKKLPMGLRERITQYYLFKYPKKYFKDRLIETLLSGKLKRDINVHLCRNLIENVSLFSTLDPDQISEIVDLLIPEIFLPNETIIQAGTPGCDIYFIFIGTVAVFTHSGKEICHLQDGAYFGEISLLFRDHIRTATIVAIEITHVFRLKQRDFERTLLNNPDVCKKIQLQAMIRMDETRREEEKFKKMVFERTYRAV